MAIDGPQTTCVKSDFYDLLHPSVALVTAREKEIHAVRRREWNRAFAAKALSCHENKISKYIDQLDLCIERDARQHFVSDLKNLLYWFGFDAMGDFVLSNLFDMLQNEEWHSILEKGLVEMRKWAEDQMKQRLEKYEDKLASPDVAQWLLKGVKADLVKEGTWAWLAGDSLLAIVGGSEPTASALIGLFCQLAKCPNHADKICGELRHLDICDPRVLAAQAHHLNACINEALRLYSALPSGGNRTTREMGITIGDNIFHQIRTSWRHATQYPDDYFERGQEFVSERWTSRPDMVRNKAAFAPFGTGSHTCLGRHLAADEMRLIVARILTKYQYKIVPGGDRVEVDLRDQFATKPGSLRVSFELRHDEINGSHDERFEGI
ncbi:cytochrome P450 [Clohesyomyces aquaticus]|uniref:Cytochrome P450 n=1 Tax=Clohesyomyces aquaticus TaxID=1231657 RepID=A0A1Y2A7X4_9PLEO|nr:cytochrome P450 [Clohesyomyces aquaticus]